jgi:hypothetical protein
MPLSDEMMRRMEEIHAAREAALKPLAEIEEERRDLRGQFAATGGPHAKAYAHAQAHGWSEEELSALGVEPPDSPLKGRPRKPRTATKRRAAKGTTAQENSSPQAAVEDGHGTPN